MLRSRKCCAVSGIKGGQSRPVLKYFCMPAWKSTKPSSIWAPQGSSAWVWMSMATTLSGSNNERLPASEWQPQCKPFPLAVPPAICATLRRPTPTLSDNSDERSDPASLRLLQLLREGAADPRLEGSRLEVGRGAIDRTQAGLHASDRWPQARACLADRRGCLCRYADHCRRIGVALSRADPLSGRGPDTGPCAG